MSKKLLFLATNYGVWAEELQAPWDACRKAGFETTLATYFGKTPLPLAISMQHFIDPLQGYNVNPAEVVERCHELWDRSGEFDHPLNIKDAQMRDYDALVIIGGSGAPLDLCNNRDVHNLVLAAIRANKSVSTLCYGVCTLGFARDPDNDFKSVVYGKSVCAHPRAWDFYDTFAYTLYNPTPDNKGTDLVGPGFNIPAQPIIEDAVGPNGRCFSDPTTNREKPLVVFDWPFMTALSVESSIAFGNKLVEIVNSPKSAHQPKKAV